MALFQYACGCQHVAQISRDIEVVRLFSQNDGAFWEVPFFRIIPGIFLEAGIRPPGLWMHCRAPQAAPYSRIEARYGPRIANVCRAQGWMPQCLGLAMDG